MRSIIFFLLLFCSTAQAMLGESEKPTNKKKSFIKTDPRINPALSPLEMGRNDKTYGEQNNDNLQYTSDEEKQTCCQDIKEAGPVIAYCICCPWFSIPWCLMNGKCNCSNCCTAPKHAIASCYQWLCCKTYD